MAKPGPPATQHTERGKATRVLLEALCALPPGARDGFVERWLELPADVDSRAPGPGLVGHHASALSALVRALLEAPVGPDDVFFDLGAGVGKVASLARLLTGAQVHALELQAELVARAPKVEGVTWEVTDVRAARLDAGTVFFLYAPFEGEVLRAVLEQLRAVPHPYVVCALGVTLTAPWLTPRETDAFWLQLYDSVPARAPREATLDPAWWRIAREE